MKIRFLKFLVTICVLACCFSLFFCLTSCLNGNGKESNLEFTLVNDKEYRVIGLGEETSTDIVIPDTYKGLPVTSIADGAFKCRYVIPRLSCRCMTAHISGLQANLKV